MNKSLKEVSDVRKSAPIQIIVHTPTKLDGKTELARRTAEIHAQIVVRRIKDLNCPTSQKLALMDAVIHTARENSRERI